MSPAELAEHRADLAALQTRLATLKNEAEATVNRIAAHFERAAAQREPDPLPRVRNAARPLGRAAWQREAEAAGRHADALAVSPRRAGAP